MTTTPNLGLTQYAGTDTINFLTRYNTDLSKIDTTTGKLSNLTTASKTNLVSATNENATNIGTLASLKTAVKTSTVGAINEVYDTTDNGWISARATLTYASASAPTFVCNTSIDLTTRISVGMKIKLTQTTVKYFFVTAITPTTITLYGGTDYVLANATISNVCYSVVKSPHGFPLNPDKWSVVTIVDKDSTLSVVGNVWKDTEIALAIPIGDWNISAKYSLSATGIPSMYGAVIWNCFLPNPTSFTSLATSVASDTSSDSSCGGTSTIFGTTRLEVSTIFRFYVKCMVNSSTVYITTSGGYSIFKATCAYL